MATRTRYKTGFENNRMYIKIHCPFTGEFDNGVFL